MTCLRRAHILQAGSGSLKRTMKEGKVTVRALILGTVVSGLFALLTVYFENRHGIHSVEALGKTGSGPPEIRVDRRRGPAAEGDGTNDKRRTEHGIARGEHAGPRCHQVGVDGQVPALVCGEVEVLLERTVLDPQEAHREQDEVGPKLELGAVNFVERTPPGGVGLTPVEPDAAELAHAATFAHALLRQDTPLPLATFLV